MAELIPLSEILGYWLGIFLTLSILSFLYKDNPFYKFAEHLFVGVSIGYVVIEQYYNVLEPKVVDRLLGPGWYLALAPLLLFFMLAARVVNPRFAWLGRYPIAMVVALYAAMEVNGLTESDLSAQLQRSMQSVDAPRVDLNSAPAEALVGLPGVTPAIADAIVAARPERRFTGVDDVIALPALEPAQRDLLAAERGALVGLDAWAGTAPGQRNWFKIFSELLLLFGLLASLIYFYFSIEQKGAVGRVSRFGVWILMIGFGASFGYTVQGRLSLAIGRALDLLGADKDPALAERIQGPVVAVASIVIIVTGLVIWEVRQKKRAGPASTTGG
jgi:hypothetical protein